jgi:hypothetical protein
METTRKKTTAQYFSETQSKSHILYSQMMIKIDGGEDFSKEMMELNYIHAKARVLLLSHSQSLN